jgi:hypothetical protein
MAFMRVARFFHARILGAGGVGGLLLISFRSGLLTSFYKQGSSSSDRSGPLDLRTEGPLLCTSKSIRNQADIKKVCSKRRRT